MLMVGWLGEGNYDVEQCCRPHYLYVRLGAWFILPNTTAMQDGPCDVIARGASTVNARRICTVSMPLTSLQPMLPLKIHHTLQYS